MKDFALFNVSYFVLLDIFNFTGLHPYAGKKVSVFEGEES